MVNISGPSGIRGTSKIFEVGDISQIEMEKMESNLVGGAKFEKVLFERFVAFGKVPSIKGFLSPPVPKRINLENLTGDENRILLRRFVLKEGKIFKDISSMSDKLGEVGKKKLATLTDVAKMVNVLNNLSNLHDSVLLKLVVEKNV